VIECYELSSPRKEPMDLPRPVHPTALGSALPPKGLPPTHKTTGRNCLKHHGLGRANGDLREFAELAHSMHTSHCRPPACQKLTLRVEPWMYTHFARLKGPGQLFVHLFQGDAFGDELVRDDAQKHTSLQR
jgi:hypothetical protein